jgi:CheY-like chemotaxis protein
VVERDVFARYVADALGRLHDRPYLEGHPLGELLGVGGRARDPDIMLQRALVDAVRELRPPEGSPPGAAEWRRYQHLVLRHVEALPPPEVARRLGVSDRQARRDHHEAVESVVALLWARRRRADPDADGGDEAPDDVLADELTRIGSAPPSGPIQLAEVLRDAADTVAPLAASRRVRIDLDLPTDPPPLAANTDALRHVLLGILSASVDWDPASHVLVRAADADGEVELRVAVRRSRGDGARDHLMPRQPFRQGDHAPSLRAARRLAEMQGGSLRARVTEDGDLALRLRLKVFRPSTVLVVDDNPDFVRLFRRYVAAEPYRIVEAKIPDEAVTLAAALRPDLVMLDVMMPSQDGWRVLRQLKGEPATRDLPVVVCSVLREPALAHSLGAVDFLSKPITQPALLACLARHCATRRAGESAGSASPPRPAAPALG